MVNKRHTRHFKLAKQMSLKSDHPQFHLGCVIAKGNTVISTGVNQLKTHTKSPHIFHAIHAEFHAILGVSVADLRGATVYVYRENKQGELALAKPCIYCNRMLEGCGVRSVYYTSNGGIDHFSYY